jgi:hypothetical protein
MSSALSHIVGKTISGVIVKEGDRTPRSQVFLLFTDGTYYELYSDSRIQGTKGVDKGGPDQVRSYFTRNRVVFEALND